MIKVILFDFSNVILLPKDSKYIGGLNVLNKKLSQESNYHFLNHFMLNKELMQFLFKKVRGNLPIYLFTFGTIQNDPEIAKEIRVLFKKIYSAGELNLDKEDSRSYLYIARDIGVKPEEIIFVDDKKVNVEAAQKAGLRVIRFKSNNLVIKELSTLL